MQNILAYGAAAGAVWLSLLVRWTFASAFGQLTYLQFFPAIIFASWFGGFGPGVLATMLAGLGAAYYLLPPDGLAVAGGGDGAALAIFTAIGVAVASLNGRLRQAHASTRREAELATMRAERLSAVINTTVDGIIVIDRRGLIESFNPAAERLFGYTQAEVIGRNVNVLMPEPYHAEHDGYIARYFATGQAAIIGKGREVRGRRKDGSVFPLHLSVGEMTVSGERKFTGVVHDLTQRVRVEEQLREQTALAHLGEMAAVIAHEVKNPLAGIRGAVQVIGGRLPADSVDAKMMKEIVSRIDSLDAMMKDLLLFARPPKPKRLPVDIVPLVQATADLLGRDEEAKRVDIRVGGAAPPVNADPEMLKMVVQNLLINSLHAVQGNGRIEVAIDTHESWLRIAVADDGPGIPAEIREKIFTPFFTTKARGTGLGLPTVKRFIDAHDGRITIDTPPAGGTTVTVQLPL